MRQGKHFNIPETEADIRLLWDEADPLDDETRPDWLDASEMGDVRYLTNVSWAYLSADEVESWDEEMEALSEADGICLDSDAGDGCVTHIYVRKPGT